MGPSPIFGPFVVMILLTFVVWVYMFVRRIAFINASGVTPEELAVPGKLDDITPPEVSNPADNFKNLFEMPVLFYAVVLAVHATGQVDPTFVIAGWVFVLFRVLHSFVHCTFNAVMIRFYLYLISCVAVWFMGARLIAAQLLGG